MGWRWNRKRSGIYGLAAVLVVHAVLAYGFRAIRARSASTAAIAARNAAPIAIGAATVVRHHTRESGVST
jgi:hypothetical protein